MHRASVDDHSLPRRQNPAVGAPGVRQNPRTSIKMALNTSTSPRRLPHTRVLARRGGCRAAGGVRFHEGRLDRLRLFCFGVNATMLARNAARPQSTRTAQTASWRRAAQAQLAMSGETRARRRKRESKFSVIESNLRWGIGIKEIDLRSTSKLSRILLQCAVSKGVTDGDVC